MEGPLRTLAVLAAALQKRPSLDEVLQLVAETAATMLGTPRASVRLLNAERTRLIAIARAGQPIHEDPNVEFAVGEGLMGWIVQHAEPIRIADADADPRFSPRATLRERLGAFLGVPLLAGSRAMGVLSVLRPSPAFDDEEQDLLGLLAAIAAPYMEIARLSRMSRVDRLTGALNRWGFDAEFPEVTPREGLVAPLSIVMADVDHFKQINDHHGHAVGDAVLATVAHRLASVVRSGDAVVRYGGEEFLLVLPQCSLAVASRVAERARLAVREPMVVHDEQLRATISLGVAERRPDEKRDEVIARADAAMYEAKRAGRDRVQVAGS